MPQRRPNADSESGYSLREVLGRAHRQGPTARWARFYRHHWRRLRARSAQRWERPAEPHDWRWAVGLVGRALVTAGLLMLGFVGYQLWGTGLSTAAAQADLKAQFAASLQTATTEVAVVTTEVPVTSVTTTSAPIPDSSTTTLAPEPTGPTTTEVERQVIPEFSSGDVVGQLVIPSIDVDFFVVSGVGVEELRLGPGHFTDTPLPGQLGNSAIAGHRTTYGQPFHDLDQLAAGDDIVITTAFGTYTYEVRDLKVVEPTDYGVVSTTDPNIATLTLTTCHPKWSAAQRLIVSAELNELESDRVLPTDTDEPTEESTTAPAPSESSTSTSTATTLPTDTSTTAAETLEAEPSEPASTPDEPSAGTSQSEQAFSAGWFHDSTALIQALIWTAILIALRVAVTQVSARRKSWWPMLPVSLAPAVIGL
ncbi:MAG: class E sortase, partial [Ilumatobacteraceae bacterium]